MAMRSAPVPSLISAYTRNCPSGDQLLDTALSSDGKGFTATGIITDYDATGNQISVGCVTQTAQRRTSLNDE
jgi:hypothetical protein